MQDDRTVGAEDLSTSSTGGLGGQTSSIHSMMTMAWTIAYSHIHRVPAPSWDFPLTLHVSGMFQVLVIRSMPVCGAEHQKFTSLEFREVTPRAAFS